MANEAGAAGATGAAGAAGATPWYGANADAETVGYLQTKGWHDKPADVAAQTILKSYREVERMTGIPANQLVKFPKDPSDTEGYNALYTRMGVPKEATAYDFKDIKFKSGEELDASFVAHMQAKAHAAHLTPQAAREMTQATVQWLEQAEAADTAEMQAKIDAQKAALAKNWGANKDANMVIARNAAAALKISAEDVNALESVVGYDRIMEMFRNIGTKIGEDKFVQSGNSAVNNGVMTREQAVASKAELMRDEVWREAYLKGDVAKGRQMLALNQIITGAQQ
jgi:hypothetical protein